MGSQFDRSDIPSLVDSFVHFSAPKFWNDPPCINGQVRYVESSKNPRILYIEPYGLNYLIRVNVDCYSVTEKIEEHEQHSSH